MYGNYAKISISKAMCSTCFCAWKFSSTNVFPIPPLITLLSTSIVLFLSNFIEIAVIGRIRESSDDEAGNLNRREKLWLLPKFGQ